METYFIRPQIAKFMWPSWGPPGAASLAIGCSFTLIHQMPLHENSLRSVLAEWRSGSVSALPCERPGFGPRTLSIINVSLQVILFHGDLFRKTPDSKVHVTIMRPTWVLAAPGGPHIGPMSLAIGCSFTLIHQMPLHENSLRSVLAEWRSGSVSALPCERPGFGPRTRIREIIPANNCTM